MAQLDLAALVAEKANEWGMGHRLDLASQWYSRCFMNKAYGTAVVFPLVIDGVHCIIAACSTAETNCMQGEHGTADGIINNPAWTRNLCYRYDGLALLNWRGLTDPMYAQSAQDIGYLQDLLYIHCPRAGIPDWRRQFGQLRGGPYLGGLRDLLRRLGVPVFFEIASGSSRIVYAAFDVYVRTFAGPYSPNVEARFLLYDRDVPAEVRYIRDPWDWWMYSVWESRGQAEPNFEYVRDYVEDLRIQIVSSIGPLPNPAERRMRVLAAQVDPPRIVALKGRGKGTSMI
jgi:hypothetical protein